jgi:guanine nucleotide-binding protein G(i) subunit alpha
MKILYNDGYSHEELLDFRLSIWRHFLETSRRIVEDLRNVGLEPANHANKVRLVYFAWHVLIPLQANCERILDHPTDANHHEFCFQPGFAKAVQELWEDDIIPVLFERSKYADNVA